MYRALKITSQHLLEAKKAVLRADPNEGAAFLLAGISQTRGRLILLVRRVVEVPEAAYRVRNDRHLDISPQAINGLVSLCDANRMGVILCHSHPGSIGRPCYSQSDDHGEARIAETLRSFLPDAPIGSLVIGPEAMRGRAWTPDGDPPLDELIEIGPSIRRHALTEDKTSGGRLTSTDEIYSRQVLAFGGTGQHLLAMSRVAIVGAGGTGSAVAEQLVRMGVLDIVLMDDDVFSRSNVTRIYGTYASHAVRRWYNPASWRQRPKVELVARHLRCIEPRVCVKAVRGNVVHPPNARLLLDRDIVFCCTDDHWGRSVVNQIAYQHMIPTINIGVRIDAHEGMLRGGTGSLHVLRPGIPCMWCYEYLRSDVIRAESLPPEDYKSLSNEKYVVGLDSPAPSVVSLTTTMAGLAVTQFLQLLTGFMGETGDVQSLRYDILDGRTRRCVSQIKGECACQKNASFGDLRDLPTCGDKALLDRLRCAREFRC